MKRTYLMFGFFTLVVLTSTTNLLYSQIEYWQKTKSPKGGVVRQIAVHPTSDDILMAELENELYLTLNGGRTWTKMLGLPNYFLSLLITAMDSVSIFVGTYKELYKSTDLGTTWSQISSFKAFALLADPQNANRIYAGSERGQVFLTADGGENWLQQNIGSESTISTLAVSPEDSNIIFAGTRGDMMDQVGDGLFRTTDGGLTWSRNSLPSSNIGSILINPNNPLIIYVGTMYDGIYKSTDNGDSWATVNSGLPNYLVYSLILKQQDHLYALLLLNGIFESKNGGITWRHIESGVGTEIINMINSSSDPDIFFVGCFYGLLKGYTNGKKFSLIGVKPVNINSICFDPQETNMLYAIGRGIFKSTDSGDSWDLFNYGTKRIYYGTIITVDPAFHEILYAGDYSPYGAVYKSIDRGDSWSSTALTDVAINDVVVDPSNTNIIYAGGLEDPYLGGMFKSSNGGVSWDTLSSKLGNATVRCIAVDPINQLIIYAGTMRHGVYKSVDGGNIWFQVNNGLHQPTQQYRYIVDLAIKPDQTNTLYAGLSNDGVYKTINGGENWFCINNGLTNLDVRSIVFDPNNTDNVFIGTYGSGVFKNNYDGDERWIEMNNGWDSVHVSSLAFKPGKDGVLYAGSYKGGVWKYIFSPSSVERKANVSCSKNFPLFQNYPNPFNLTTTIRYNLSKSGIVKITVYNVSGEEAAVLVNEEKQPGTHTLQFKAVELSSGIYFYRMEVNDVVEIKKFLFIK